MASGTGSWVRVFHPGRVGSPRLVCLPHAGGSASFFFPLSAALTPAVEVLAVQYPGRQDRRLEPCPDSIDGLADGVVGALDRFTDRPLALFGHSLGAALAFEVARRLQRNGVSPVRLFASGRRAPSCHRDERVHLLDDEGLLAELRSLSGTAPHLLGDDEVLRMIMPALRSDYRAIETYRCPASAAVSAPITVLTGDSDPTTTVDEAAAWDLHTTAGADLHVFPGGHFFLADHRRDVAALVAGLLTGDLAQDAAE